MFERLERVSSELASVLASIEEHSGAMLAETEGLEYRQYMTLHARAKRTYEVVSDELERLGREVRAAELYRARA